MMTTNDKQHYKHMCLTNKVNFSKDIYKNYKHMCLITGIYSTECMDVLMDTCVVYKNMHTYHTAQNFDEEKC